MRNVLGALYSSIGAVTAIYQTQCNISYNTIDHMAAGGTPSIVYQLGVFMHMVLPVCIHVNNNTITMVEQSISTAYAVYGIYGNAASPTITAQNNTITISEIAGGSAVNNFAIFLPNANSTTITNNTVTQNMAVSGTTYGIYTTSSGTTITSDNTITQTSSAATSSQFYSIVSGSTNTVSETITNNKFANSNVSVVRRHNRTYRRLFIPPMEQVMGKTFPA